MDILDSTYMYCENNIYDKFSQYIFVISSIHIYTSNIGNNSFKWAKIDLILRASRKKSYFGVKIIL